MVVMSCSPEITQQFRNKKIASIFMVEELSKEETSSIYAYDLHLD
jgi:hypothetical protein